jgi:uncharacterized membrane protein
MSAAAVGRARVFMWLAVVVTPLVFHLVIVETSRVPLSSHLGFVALFRISFVTVSAITHWVIYGGLLATFASTLRPGREALISVMARRLHGTMPDELRIYTRRVTYAWSIFFAMQLTLSVTLFFAAPLVVWSFFVNVLDIPLVAAMFAAEYLCRIHCLENPPRHSLSAILGMIADVRKSREEWASST